MSGFSADWLALREPADRAARDAALIDELGRYLDSRPQPRIMDLGCGTGSTWRALAPALGPMVDWQLVDHDPALLEQARRMVDTSGTLQLSCKNINNINSLNFSDVSIVTASALFDLCSEHFCRRLFAQLAASGCGLYAALNYDGVTEWSLPHPLDGEAVAAFNRHQRQDKGFGPALGPQAGNALAELAEAHGYRLRRAQSPWRLTGKDAALHTAFVEGFRQPLHEIGWRSAPEREAWLAFRLAHVADSLCRVGHNDILALPHG